MIYFISMTGKCEIEIPEDVFETIDPEVRDLVEILNCLGIRTWSSCAGHIDNRILIRPHPWVAFEADQVDESKFAEFRRHLNIWNEFKPNDRWKIIPVEEPLTRYESQIIYLLSPEDPNLEKDSTTLTHQQRQLTEIARFLQENWQITSN